MKASELEQLKAAATLSAGGTAATAVADSAAGSPAQKMQGTLSRLTDIPLDDGARGPSPASWTHRCSI
eukprot:2405524-Prymnesium_polylepis.1